jgi:hypothetical protein
VTVEYREERTITGEVIRVPVCVRPDPVTINITSQDLYDCPSLRNVQDLIAMRLSARGVQMKVIDDQWQPVFGTVTGQRDGIDDFGAYRVTWTP